MSSRHDFARNEDHRESWIVIRWHGSSLNHYFEMNRNLLILLVEDDSNDALLVQRAFSRNGINNAVHSSVDGEDAINYLKGEGKYSDRGKYPFPSLLITDLKMP